MGVFLTDSALSQPAPPLPDFSYNKSFTSISPLIAQFFFIGDGRTGTGSGDVQKFYVPETATRLYLGFIDSTFSDNLGSLTATVEINAVPEPFSFIVWSLLGAGGVGVSYQRRRSKARHRWPIYRPRWSDRDTGRMRASILVD